MFSHATRAAGLCAAILLSIPSAASAQESGFRGFLQRTANAITGQPAAARSPTALPGTVSTGNAVTDGPAYRPVSPGDGGTFPEIFRSYTTVNNPGKFPRASLYFETFGASQACWRTRATIWTTESRHYEETFDLCNAPLTARDDLGHTTAQADPTTSLLVPMSKETFAPGISITPDHTMGPNPPRLPFAMNMGSAPNATLLLAQYHAIVARALVISGYATNTHNPLMWIAGFNPDGNRDEHRADR